MTSSWKIALLSAGFGLLANVLAAIGRVRLALGAQRGTLLWLVMKEVLTLLSTAAIAAGLIPAHRASRIDPILAIRFE